MTHPAIDTRQKLVLGALAEFNDHGYFGTDSNKIAKRSGFAPQTFYRWFPDKKAVFLAAYAFWWQSEVTELGAMLAQQATPRALAEAIVAHHRLHVRFRRSLRFLTTEDEDVRAARAAGRLAQLDRMAAIGRQKDRSVLAGQLLMIERWCDALADGEFSDLGVSDVEALDMIAQALDGVLTTGDHSAS